MDDVQAKLDFREARRKAFFEKILALLTNRAVDLLPFEEVRRRLRLRSQYYRGLQDIPLDRIVGSVSRYHDFTRTFLPRHDAMRDRWQRVDSLVRQGGGLPPIEVYQVGEVYFVKDGNHRVSVARQAGAPTIEAYVWEFPTPVPLTAEDDLDDLLLKHEYAEFLKHTGLDRLRPEQHIEFTTPGHYQELEEHIAVHRYYLGLEQGREIPYEEAVTSWYDNVYMPMVRVIREQGVLKEFPGRTEADLYVWIMTYRHFLSERYGQPVALEEAAEGYAEHFGQRCFQRLRRWLGKLIDLPLILALAGCALLTACASSATPTVPPSTNVILDAKAPTYEQAFTVATEGIVVLTLTAAGPGSDWGTKGAEAAVLSVHVDGKRRADVVLYGGAASHTYPVHLGELTAGEHYLALLYEPKQSAKGAKSVAVETLAFETYTPEEPLYLPLRYAPILYGRRDAARSDVPLLMAYRQTEQAGTTEIEYTVIFSNEDGGTEPEGLMARWGRLTDIEWVYRVWLAKDGTVVHEEYQGEDHKTQSFAGQKEGQQPLLAVVTLNNMVGEAEPEASTLRFALAPLEAMPSDHSREEIMDRHPWTYRIMAQEWSREGMEPRARPKTARVSDPRNYLYVEFESDHVDASGAPTTACDLGLALQVKLRGDETWYSSDHKRRKLRLVSRGWRRGAIELPEGTDATALEALRLVIYPGEKASDCRFRLRRIGKVFLLGEDYAPQPSLLSWQGELLLDVDPDTAESDQVTFKIQR